ncbi:transposable element Tcb1 transposase [Trichonephila clavipes]|nr:transposable element Tcb1 transposase [Trichonephila clavipes]
MANSWAGQIEVARWLNVSPSVIHRLWQQYLTTDSTSRRFSQGRSRATMSADDRYLPLYAQRNKTQLRLNSDPPVASSGWLVSRRERFQCQHVHWMRDQWSAVLFEDDSEFSLESDCRCIFIWKELGTRFHRKNAYG